MKGFLLISLLTATTALHSAAAWAQPEDPFAAPPPMPTDLPPLAELPEDPFASAPPPMPIEPMTAPTNQAASDFAAPALPALDDPDNFDFFQQGAQLPPMPDGNLPPLPETIEDAPIAPANLAPVSPPKNPHERPFKKRFDYKNQILSERVYRPNYDAQNRHLPVAQTQNSYDKATFAAAASNNLDGLRAMLEHGGRSREMRNENGETLADVAYRFRAFDTLHYLTAIGVPRAQRQSSAQQDAARLAMNSAN